MQSEEFVIIYDNAASLVEARCKDLPGLPKLLADIRCRISCEEHNPLKNRQLIFEPRQEAQRLEVPQESARMVAEELHRLDIFHLWVRAVCPAVHDGPSTVVETDNGATFRDALNSPCPQCSRFHEHISWNDLETFYAINFDGGPDKLDIRRLFRARRTLKKESSRRERKKRKWSWQWPKFSKLKKREAATEIASALAINGPISPVPDRVAVCVTVWKLAGGYVAGSVIVFLLVHQIWGPYIATAVAGMLSGGFVISSWVTLRVVMAAPLIQRMLVAGAFLGTTYMILKSHFDVSFVVSKNEPWSFAFKSHETDWPSVILAGIIMGIGVGGACMHQWTMGWMQKG